MEQQTDAHCAFVVETYFQNGDSTVIAQRLFRHHFSVPRHEAVPSQKTIKLWIIITVWCAVSNFGFIRLYFFEVEGQMVTVTSTRYTEMLQKFFAPELRHHRIDLNGVWLQHDGTKAHTATASMAVIREMFPDHVIAR